MPRPGFSSRSPASAHPLGPRIHPRNRRPASPRPVCKSLNTFPPFSNLFHSPPPLFLTLARSLSRHNDVLFATHPRFHDELTLTRIFRSSWSGGGGEVGGGREEEEVRLFCLSIMRCRIYYFFFFLSFLDGRNF